MRATEHIIARPLTLPSLMTLPRHLRAAFYSIFVECDGPVSREKPPMLMWLSAVAPRGADCIAQDCCQFLGSDLPNPNERDAQIAVLHTTHFANGRFAVG